ncbi:MAG: hypothetical protein AB7I36_08320 [Rhodospirillaceae bacterium]
MNQIRKPQALAATRKVMDVERLLIWAYQTQGAEMVTKHGVGLVGAERFAAGGGKEPRSLTPDSAVIVAGTLMGGGSSGGAVLDLHPDAEAVHACVRRLTIDVREDVIKHATAGSQPEWGETVRMRPMLNDMRRPLVVYRNNRPFYCRIESMPGPLMRMKMRERYLSWWEALASIALELESRGVLTMHTVTMPWRISPMPWLSREKLEGDPYYLTLRKRYSTKQAS